MRTEETPYVYVRDLVTSVGLVLLIALILFGVSGVWPPLVAVESGSMEPHMQRGDMVFVVEQDRFVGDGYIEGTGIVTYETGAESGYTSFGNPGDVIIFRPGGSEVRTPVIHRAHFWVERGENWIATKADPMLTNGRSCSQLSTCPAPYAGFVTYGDANTGYDQTGAGADTSIVKPAWIEGKAKYRVPWLGHIRLTVDETFATADLAGAAPSGPVPVLGVVAPSGLVLIGLRRTRRQ
ncbi:S26 family signal peptidase [Halovivax limisalsi]|uniref:S26 family signal peptidase n=1 Tax=Halovivax limisalsi TaxID=1453760 RepID=UPI001FFDA3B5|nr:S26 family signal peptidase [Halovivax limisalsi]